MILFLLLTLLLLHVIKSLYRYFTRTLNYWSKRGINGPTPLPLFGNFIDNFFNPLNVLEEKRLMKYGSVYGYFEFSQPVLTVGDPKLIREVMIEQFQNFTNRYNRNPEFEFQNKGLFFMQDDAWKSVRKLISPAFTISKLKKMFGHVQKCCDNTLQYVDDVATQGREIVLKDVMKTYIMDSIAKCFFGVETNGHKDPQNEFLNKATDLARLKLWRIFVTLLTPVKLQYPLNLQMVDRRVITYFKCLLQNIIEERKKQNVERGDFIDLLLKHKRSDYSDDSLKKSSGHLNENFEAYENSKAKSTLDNDDIFANSILFLVAGFDTTSTLLNFTLYSLALNPVIQDTLFEEVNKNFRQQSTVNYDSLNSLKYLDAVIREALRLYSPALVTDRVAANDCILGRLKIEKGTVISFPFYALHRNPEHFMDPHCFKPERFLPENKDLLKPYTYLPFGDGPRICIGMLFSLMTAKLFLSNFTRNYMVVQTSNTPALADLKYSNSFITLSSEPLFVKFVKRN